MPSVTLVTLFLEPDREAHAYAGQLQGRRDISLAIGVGSQEVTFVGEPEQLQQLLREAQQELLSLQYIYNPLMGD